MPFAACPTCRHYFVTERSAGPSNRCLRCRKPLQPSSWEDVRQAMKERGCRQSEDHTTLQERMQELLAVMAETRGRCRQQVERSRVLREELRQAREQSR
jgi:hypothetical protein